ncbi:MAG: Gfo/Idh/MocA family oxidoreductase [Caldilineaceae bacterium]|nr:Gfo/Idh/MocA family oxidoreductase [Caldilineaceae bacterium]
MRAGMVGLAALYWPQTLGKGLAAHPAVDFRAAATLGVADETIAAMLGSSPQEYADHFGINLYSDAREMIAAEALDAVVLISPHSQHADWVERLAPLGVNIFIPKTFATTLADAQRIVQAETQQGIRIASGPTARYLPIFMAVKNALAAGMIGDPFSLRLCHHHGTLDVFSAADWYRDPAEGGPELSLGWYGIDLILHLLDDQVTQIYATYNNFTSPESPFMDCGRMVLEMARGGSAVFDMLFCNRFAYPSWQLEITGPDGMIAVQRAAPDSNSAVVTLHNAQGTRVLPLPEQTPGWEHFWIDEFVTGRTLSLDAAQALEITRLSLIARQSAQRRQALAAGDAAVDAIGAEAYS